MQKAILTISGLFGGYDTAYSFHDKSTGEVRQGLALLISNLVDKAVDIAGVSTTVPVNTPYVVQIPKDKLTHETFTALQSKLNTVVTLAIGGMKVSEKDVIFQFDSFVDSKSSSNQPKN